MPSTLVSTGPTGPLGGCVTVTHDGRRWWQRTYTITAEWDGAPAVAIEVIGRGQAEAVANAATEEFERGEMPQLGTIYATLISW